MATGSWPRACQHLLGLLLLGLLLQDCTRLEITRSSEGIGLL